MTVSSWTIQPEGISITAQHIAAVLTGQPPGDAWWLDGGSLECSYLAWGPVVRLESTDLDALAWWEDERQKHRELVWFCCVSYDAAADFLVGRQIYVPQFPGVVVRGFQGALALHPDGTATVLGRVDLAVLAQASAGRLVGEIGPSQALWSAEYYRSRVDLAKAHIKAGDTYQVNLSQRFFAPWTSRGSQPLAALCVGYYLKLRERAPARLGACFAVPSGQWVLSNSPETLVEVMPGPDGSVISSRPIKGTRPRGVTGEHDAALAAELIASSKDAAEHVMIVDLIRNDLGRVCAPASVRADRRPTCVTLPTVHHLISRVEGILLPNATWLEVLLSVLPGGSVTGAPKRRTVELIAEIEAEPRAIYCGTVMLATSERLVASIPIRTAIGSEDGIHLRSGGGIVCDSDPEEERLETLAKASAFFCGK